ncbi:hypothetical protein H7X87_02065 [Acetobacteraceae bacterium]|nr:hypothetical protein [Candidatus Parcubacteria bacterium]
MLEILIVIGLFAIIGTFAMFIDMGSLFGNSFRGEERTIVTLLQNARADAMDNVGQAPHGLAIYPADNPDAYVLFAQSAYATDPLSHRVVEEAYDIEISGAPVEIVFEQLSGNSNFEGTITLTDPNRGITSEITINHEGAISW